MPLQHLVFKEQLNEEEGQRNAVITGALCRALSKDVNADREKKNVHVVVMFVDPDTGCSMLASSIDDVTSLTAVMHAQTNEMIASVLRSVLTMQERDAEGIKPN